MMVITKGRTGWKITLPADGRWLRYCESYLEFRHANTWV